MYLVPIQQYSMHHYVLCSHCACKARREQHPRIQMQKNMQEMNTNAVTGEIKPVITVVL